MNIGSGIESLRQILPQDTTSSNQAAKPAALPPESLSTEPTDRAVLSPAANQLAVSPPSSDVRLDKVASIQNALASGTYQVDASDVAKKVIDALLSIKI